MNPDVARRIHGLQHLIGNTPMIAVDLSYHGRPRRIYAKAEHVNLSGSIKDRMALHILRRAYEDGRLRPGQPIVEATSGNTGISIAAIGRALGHPVTIYMPDWMSRERTALIRSLGATIHQVSREDGGFLGSIRGAESCGGANGDGFLPRQFDNVDNVEAHVATTGPEIWWQMRYHGLRPDAFVAGVGTGGTVMGVGRYLRSAHPGIRIHPLEPANSPTLRTGCKVGKHRIQGISDEFIPQIVDLAALDGVVDVDDGDAIVMAQRLAAEVGLAVGISSGANFLGAVKLQEAMGGDAVVVTVFPDDNKKYLSTDLLREEEVKDGFVSPAIRLLGFDAFKRVCRTCCDPQSCAEMAAVAAADPGELDSPVCPLWKGTRR